MFENDVKTQECKSRRSLKWKVEPLFQRLNERPSLGHRRGISSRLFRVKAMWVSWPHSKNHYLPTRNHTHPSETPMRLIRASRSTFHLRPHSRSNLLFSVNTGAELLSGLESLQRYTRAGTETCCNFCRLSRIPEAIFADWISSRTKLKHTFGANYVNLKFTQTFEMNLKWT